MDEMFKELGKYMIDVSKYVLTTVLLSLLFSDKSNVSLYVVTTMAICGVLLVFGLSMLIIFVPIMLVGVWVHTSSARKFFGVKEEHKEVKK